MKYEELEELIKKYGDNFLGDNTMQTIFRDAKYSESLKREIEGRVDEEWIERVKELEKVLVYTDYNFSECVPDKIKKEKGALLFPYIDCGYQDRFTGERKIPCLKYVKERQRNKIPVVDTRFGKER